MVYFDNFLQIYIQVYIVKHCIDIDIQSNYESSLSISPVRSWSMSEHAHNS